MADPDLGTYLGFKPLLAKLREQQPVGAATKEVREALAALNSELVPCLPPKLGATDANAVDSPTRPDAEGAL